MDRIRKWLIHKLGGVYKLPTTEPFVVYKSHNIVPVVSVFRIGNDYYDDEFYKEELSRMIASELLKSGLINIDRYYVGDGITEFRAKVYVLRGEQNG